MGSILYLDCTTKRALKPIPSQTQRRTPLFQRPLDIGTDSEYQALVLAELDRLHTKLHLLPEAFM